MRLDFGVRENALSRALRARRAPYIDLTVSNPTAIGLPLVAPVLPAAPLYDPQPRGLLVAREAVAAVHGVSADRVLLTASTSEAYSWLFKLLCDPGDEVLVPQPCYPLFEYLTALEGVRAVPYSLRHDGEWHIAGLPVSPRTRAVLIVNPGNPTGNYLPESDLRLLQGLGLPAISDEVFAEFPVSQRGLSLAGNDSLETYTLSGLSKSCGLPQLKLGWIVAGGPHRLEQLELIADTYLSVSTPVQLAAPELLAQRSTFQSAMLQRIRKNLSALLSLRSTDAPWDVLRPEAGWSVVLGIPQTQSEEEWALSLLDEGVLVHPGYFFDFPSGAHLVLSLIAEDFAQGAAIVARVLSGRARG